MFSTSGHLPTGTIKRGQLCAGVWKKFHVYASLLLRRRNYSRQSLKESSRNLIAARQKRFRSFPGLTKNSTKTSAMVIATRKCRHSKKPGDLVSEESTKLPTLFSRKNSLILIRCHRMLCLLTLNAAILPALPGNYFPHQDSSKMCSASLS